MPQPYLIGDERAFSDFMTNPSSNPVFAVSGLLGQQAGISAASAAIAATETIVVQKSIETVTLQPGSMIKFIVDGTSTSTVANTTTFNVYIGAAGTTADAKVVTFTTAAAGTTGTNVLFRLVGEIEVRAVGATATAYYTFQLTPASALAIGGSASTVFFNGTQNANFNTTTAIWISLSCVNAASTTAETFQIASIEVLP